MILLFILFFIVVIISVCAYFVSKAAYRSQVKNAYKHPMLTSTIVFILTFALLAAGVFFLLLNNINISR